MNPAEVASVGRGGGGEAERRRGGGAEGLGCAGHVLIYFQKLLPNYFAPERPHFPRGGEK